MDYQLNYASLTIEDSNFINDIPSELLEENRLFLIPTKVFNILIREIRNNNNNFKFINEFLSITRLLYLYNNREISYKYLQNISREYSYYIDLLDEVIIKKEKYFNINKQEPNKNYIEPRLNTYSLYVFRELTFISLIEKEDNILLIDFDLSLSDTPLDNDTYINTLYKCQIDASAAIMAEYKYCFSKNDEDNLQSFISRVNSILSFKSRRYARKGTKVNRVYSSFSELSKVSRKYVTYNTRDFYEIDIKNCQPLLLVLALIENGYDVDDNYIELTTNGLFYEHFLNNCDVEFEYQYVKEKKCMVKFIIDYKKMLVDNPTEEQIINAKNQARENIKSLCYGKIFYCKEIKEKSAILDIFKKSFPKTFKSLCSFIDDLGDIKLANVMQDLEADIVLNVIPDSPYYTVHDAIYVTNLTEIPVIQNKLLEVMSKRSGDRIKKVSFGNVDSTKKEYTKRNLSKYSSISIQSKKTHSGMKNRYDQFLELYSRYNEKEMCSALNITRKTYFNYKKKMIQKQ